MTPSDTVIVAQEVTKRFGSFVAVDHVSFSISRGEIVALLGPNGAGKTTLIRVLVGLLPRDHGILRVLGMDPAKDPRSVRRVVGYMPQILSLYQELTVGELLDIFARLYGLTSTQIKNTLDRLRDEYRLSDWWGRRVEGLPRGIQQRVGLGLARLADPPILLLDEPTSGVAAGMRQVFWKTLRAFRNEGKTIVVTTHDLREAEQADRILSLYAGRVVADGTLQDLREKRQCEVVRLPISSWEVVASHRPPGVVLPRGRFLDVVVAHSSQPLMKQWMNQHAVEGRWIPLTWNIFSSPGFDHEISLKTPSDCLGRA